MTPTAITKTYDGDNWLRSADRRWQWLLCVWNRNYALVVTRFASKMPLLVHFQLQKCEHFSAPPSCATIYTSGCYNEMEGVRCDGWKVSERLSFDLRTFFRLLFACYGKKILLSNLNYTSVSHFLYLRESCYFFCSFKYNLTRNASLILSEVLFPFRPAIFNSLHCGAHRNI